MASKALARMRAELDAAKARGRKSLANVKEKLGDPKKAAILVLLGVAIGFIAPKMVFSAKPGEVAKDARNKRRYFRLAIGGALIAFGMKKNRDALLVGIGIVGSEALATGIEMAGDKLGAVATEIGALDGMSPEDSYRLPRASYSQETL